MAHEVVTLVLRDRRIAAASKALEIDRVFDWQVEKVSATLRNLVLSR